MIIKSADNLFFKANDLTNLTEVLHPKNNKLDLPYSLAFAYLEAGETSLLHVLKETEVYFIMKGKGEIRLGEIRYFIEKGDCVVVLPDIEQSVTNTGECRLEFLCIVSPPWTESGEKIIEPPK